MTDDTADSDPHPRSNTTQPGRAIFAGGGVAPASATIHCYDPDALIAAADLRSLHIGLTAALRHLAASGDVRIRLVNDADMARAHEQYSGIAGTTDVLTFDLRDSGADPTSPLDVDILACVDEARRQAAPRGHSLTHELLLYALHGVLHCLGHDDHDDAAYARMHTLEDQTLEAIGFGRVFDSAAAARAEGGAA